MGRRRVTRKKSTRRKKSRTQVFDITGLKKSELRKTELGKRIIELAERNLPDDISFIEDELLDRFKQGTS